jgi:LDH2 family malate/lactate/ureidoglycolate dehydrogenase
MTLSATHPTDTPQRNNIMTGSGTVTGSGTLAFRPDTLRQFITDAFLGTGLSRENASAAADVLATADEFGVSTHGVKLLGAYLTRLAGGGIKVNGKPSVLREGPSWAIVDGDDALGMVTGNFCMSLAIAKAKQGGIAYVGARRSSHFGAAGYYALQAALGGLIGVAVANDVPSVVAPGARQAVVGTNPFSYAIPARKHPPVLLDIAISTVAGGKVYASRMLGKPIPNDWIVGKDGLPTTDAEAYPDNAFLVPAGGHKGYGLALLIETLSGLVTGAGVTSGVGSWMMLPSSAPTNHGAAFIAIDPRVFGTDEFYDRTDAMIDEIHATPTAPGVSKIIVPGEREFANQKRVQTEPLVLPEDVAANVRKAAEIAKLSLSDYVLA